MAKIVAVTGCPTGIAHTIMAAEALKKTAKAMGHDIKVETQGAEGAKNVLTESDIAAADVVIISSDIHVDMSRFAGKNVYGATTSEAIRYTQGVIESALQESQEEAPPPNPETVGPPKVEATAEKKYIISITSCPTGIAHTFMAAEGVKSGAESLGHEVKVETQGSVGSQNTLTPEDIQRADILLIAADTKIDKSRFVGKRIYETSTKAAIHDGAKVVETALAEATVYGGAGAAGKADLAAEVDQLKKQRSAARTGPYKHLMTGVSYMLPFVVAGGLLIALAFAFGGIYVYDNEGSFGWALFQIGAPSAFALMVPILSGFIAYSIADRPGIAPGMIGGMLASSIGAGFLGGIVSGFIAGYFVAWFSGILKLPRGLEGLKPILILPLVGSAVTGLLMIYVVGTPVKIALDALTTWLSGMQETSALVLGLILGAMMAFDMGGPINKSAYAFSVGLIDAGLYAPMAAVMAAGMTPPLGLALATVLFKDRFTAEEREAGKAAWVLGASFITEGAIPFAAKDPFRVIPSIMVGSAVAGGLSMFFGCTLQVPHGGIFVLPIPNAVGNLPMYVVAILVGTVVTTAMLFLLKKPVNQPVAQPMAVAASEAAA
ncbi:MAG TPA: PTS fructose-like transporter subunit IIB [Anaerolineae bacterium]|nr:PTS fructose-like transporter subunit IIB [Anaerolineae bacterium]MCB0226021.1 PTS fructose-like transporter subunit IIB [Anaerolineae bacterium]MCB9107112.1 PTS fructose-like transporter subunit IIB [Anaerolineales bacterium]HRV93157.1 PTS fructose-like transporter subunit IIB [Anaerolineae bacterium]